MHPHSYLLKLALCKLKRGEEPVLPIKKIVPASLTFKIPVLCGSERINASIFFQLSDNAIPLYGHQRKFVITGCKMLNGNSSTSVCRRMEVVISGCVVNTFENLLEKHWSKANRQSTHQPQIQVIKVQQSFYHRPMPTPFPSSKLFS